MKDHNSRKTRFLPGFGRLSATAIAYSLAVLLTCAYDLAGSQEPSAIRTMYFVELFVLIAATELIDWLLGKAISNVVLFLAVDFAAICALSVGGALLLGWIDKTPGSIAGAAGIVLVVFVIVYATFIRRNRKDAKEINERINAQKPER